MEKSRERRRLIEEAPKATELRVIELRRVLAAYDIPHSAKLRKAQLIQIYQDDLVPKLMKLEEEYKDTAVKKESSATPTKKKKRKSIIGAKQKESSSPKSRDDESVSHLSQDNVFQTKKRKAHPTDENDTPVNLPPLKKKSTYKKEFTLTSDESTNNDDTSTGTVRRYPSPDFDQLANSTSLMMNEGMDQELPIAQGTPNGTPVGTQTSDEGETSDGSSNGTPKDLTPLEVGDKSITPIEDSLVLKSYSDASEVETPSPKRISQPIVLKGPVGDLNENRVKFDVQAKPRRKINRVKTPEISMDSDILTHLQSEIELEKSRIEDEFEKTFEIYDYNERTRVIQLKVFKFITWFTLFVIIVKIILIYLRERTQIGFCGFEIKENWINLPFKSHIIDTINTWHLECVPCPYMGQCYPNSKLSCTSDYKVSTPLLWSIFGLIPTYNECIIDSNKLRIIKKIIDSTMDVLAVRNANVKCGLGLDNEVGLQWDQIVEFVSDKIGLDRDDELFEYYWSKSHAAIVGKPQLVFTNDGIIRSHSNARMSWKCQIQTSLFNLVYKFRFYLMSVTLLGLLLLWIFMKISKWQRRKESIRELTQSVFDKLQDQFKRRKARQTDTAYLSKIQLRDYYLPKLKMSKKDSQFVWEQVASNVEQNTNVRTTEQEIDGDIRRVWEWTLDLF